LFRFAIVSAVFIFAVGTTLIAQQASGYGKRGPRLRFDASVHNFGEMKDDAGKATYDWVFYNDGDEPLRITGTRPSCGCTASVVTADPIAPGEQGVLLVTFDPAGQHGTIRKTLTVSSNDPSEPNLLLTIKAKVEVVIEEVVPGQHPKITGQSLLMGDCASCHAAPAEATSGAPLYTAVCAMCHGTEGQGNERGPSLRDPDYLASRDDDDLNVAIAYGTSNPRMPGFSEIMGGPLSDAQVKSLVELIRRWGPLSAAAPHLRD
jgi:mono/diheme cytochrome c family protein